MLESSTKFSYRKGVVLVNFPNAVQLQSNKAEYERWVNAINASVDPVLVQKLKRLSLFHMVKKESDEQTLEAFNSILSMGKLLSRKELANRGISAASVGGTLEYDGELSRDEYVFFSTHYWQKRFSNAVVFASSCSAAVKSVSYPDAFFCNDYYFYRDEQYNQPTAVQAYEASVLEPSDGVDITAKLVAAYYPNVGGFSITKTFPSPSSDYAFTSPYIPWFNPEVGVKDEVLLTSEFTVLIIGSPEFTAAAEVVAKHFNVPVLVLDREPALNAWYHSILE